MDTFWEQLIYLRFARRQLPGVDVCSLESGKEELDGDARVAMWPREHDWQLLLLVEEHYISRLVIGSPVQQYHRIMSPPAVLLIQQLNEVGKNSSMTELFELA